MLEKTRILEYLRLNRYEFVSKPDNADYILLVTCAFKKAEEDHSILRLNALRGFKGKLLVYGCLPDIRPDIMPSMNGIQTLAPKDLDRIDEYFDEIDVRFAEVTAPGRINYYDKVSLIEKAKTGLFSRELLHPDHRQRLFYSAKEHLRNLLMDSRVNCYLYVSRGCLGRCTYCVIRRAIGPVTSKPQSQVLSDLSDGFAAGSKQFHLLGDDLGCYGIDLGCTLPDLLAALLDECERLETTPGSPGPGHQVINLHLKEVGFKYLVQYEERLDILGSARIKSLLCPIQSGSDRILSLMMREHSAQDVRRIIARIRDINPGLRLSTQVIVGFPSETEQDFGATLKLLEELRFDEVVVFPYHAKENTPAFKLEGKIPEDVIQQRQEKALNLLKSRHIHALSSCPL